VQFRMLKNGRQKKKKKIEKKRRQYYRLKLLGLWPVVVWPYASLQIFESFQVMHAPKIWR
jgi:hypothetical protein